MKSRALALCCVAALAAPALADQAKITKGQELYATHKCKMCHAIGGEGNKKNALDGVGSRLDAEAIRKWIVSPKEMKADVKKPDFSKKIAGEDLDALVAYLASLKQ